MDASEKSKSDEDELKNKDMCLETGAAGGQIRSDDGFKTVLYDQSVFSFRRSFQVSDKLRLPEPSCQSTFTSDTRVLDSQAVNANELQSIKEATWTRVQL